MSPRFVEFEINGRKIRIQGDPLTTVLVYIATFVVFYIYDKLVVRKEVS